MSEFKEERSSSGCRRGGSRSFTPDGKLLSVNGVPVEQPEEDAKPKKAAKKKTSKKETDSTEDKA